MTSQPTTEQHAGEFVAYEYASVRAPRDLESLYQDSYRSFGWTVESTKTADPIRPLPLTPAIHPNSVTLNLKRDRRIKNRQIVITLQRRAETALASIARLERSKSSIAMAVAVTIGIVGAAFLAGSIFSMNGGMLVLSIVLGAVGLLLWLGGFASHIAVKARRTAKVGPLIDREYEVLYETSEQASGLLH